MSNCFLSCVARSFHATMDMLFYPHSILWEGTHFHISVQKSFLDSSVLHFSPIPNFAFLSEGVDFSVFSTVSSITLHCSINPCLWEGVGVACQTALLLYILALSFHTTRKTIQPFFWEGPIFSKIVYIFFSFRISSIIRHASPIPYFKKFLFDPL